MSENQPLSSPYFSTEDQSNQQNIENSQNDIASEQQPMQIGQNQLNQPQQDNTNLEEEKPIDSQEQSFVSRLDKYIDKQEIFNQKQEVEYINAQFDLGQEIKKVRIYKREYIRQEEIEFIEYAMKFQYEFESSKPNSQLPSNIVRIYEWFEEQQYIYIVMEETGESLKTKLKYAFKDEPKKISVCKQIAEAVIFLHNNRIIHRSLKPDDFVEADQVFKLINFSFLRQNNNLRMTNTTIEVNEYSAPELVFQNKKGDFSLDIWSLGVIFFEIFSGNELIDKKLQETIQNIKKNNCSFKINDLKYKFSQKLSQLQVSDEIAKLLNSMLNWEQSQRPSISKIEEELQKLIMKEASKQETINYSYLVNSIISAPTKKDPDRRFHLIKILGDGAEGGVFRAKVKNDSIFKDQEVAVKIQPKFKDNEFQFLEKLITDQKNNTLNYIIKIYEKFEWSGKQLLVMELGQKDLYQYIQDNSNIDIKQKQKICFEISKSIEYIHELGLIHRDIKPENFLLIDSTFKLIDFGLIKKKENNNLRQTIAIGTPLYQAIELAEGNDQYSFPVDIWSLGCIYYEIFSGQPLFDGINQQQLKLQIMNHKLSQEVINNKINQLQVDDLWKTLIIKMTHPSSEKRIKIKDVMKEIPKPEFQFSKSFPQNNFQPFQNKPIMPFQQFQQKPITFNQVNITPQKINQQDLEQQVLIEFIKILETVGNQTNVKSFPNWKNNEQKLIGCIKEIIQDGNSQKQVFTTQFQQQQQQIKNNIPQYPNNNFNFQFRNSSSQNQLGFHQQSNFPQQQLVQQFNNSVTGQVQVAQQTNPCFKTYIQPNNGSQFQQKQPTTFSYQIPNSQMGFQQNQMKK